MTRQVVPNRFVAMMVAVTLLGGLVLSSAPSAQADPILEEECYPAVLLLRGSGEVQLLPQEYPLVGSESEPTLISTNGHEGETLHLLLDAVAKQTNPADTVSKLRFIGIDYPALEVELPDLMYYPENPLGNAVPAPGVKMAVDLMNTDKLVSYYLGDYSDSMTTGAVNAAKFVQDDLRRGCDTQYMLVGYSQGALAARMAMNIMGNNPEKLIGSYLIGDPFQKPSDVWNERQTSPASTGSHKEGGLRGALDKASDFSSLASSLDMILTKSDQTAYRDDGLGGAVSRSLCHDLDPACALWVSIFDVEQHTNYFDGAVNPGILDLSYEPVEFDRQIQILADSQTANPRERVLTKSVSIEGRTTSYNIANMRPDDICSWDEGSDGTYESVSILCGLYATTHAGDEAEMTVQILDSFGITHTYSTKEPVIDPVEIANLASVPYDKWMRFESFVAPTECVTIPMGFDDNFYNNPHRHVRSQPCLTSPTNEVDFNATQVFKKVRTEEGGESYDRYLWGYDDDYMLDSTSRSNYPGESGVVGYPRKASSSPSSGSAVSTELAQIRDGVSYYQLKFTRTDFDGIEEEWCPTHNLQYEDYTLDKCDPTNDRQLFKAVPAGEGYGAFSLSRDDEAPTKVTGFEVVQIQSSSVDLRWDASTDNRYSGVDYYLLEMYDPNRGSWRFGTWIRPPETSGTKYMLWSDQKIRVSACDHAGNCSATTELTVPWGGPE